MNVRQLLRVEWRGREKDQAKQLSEGLSVPHSKAETHSARCGGVHRALHSAAPQLPQQAKKKKQQHTCSSFTNFSVLPFGLKSERKKRKLWWSRRCSLATSVAALTYKLT